MGKAVEIAGQRFGRLLVLERLPNKVNSVGNQKSVWQVRCDCGQEKELCADDLRSGKVKSCGCWKKELLSLPNGVAAKNRVLNYYRQHARQRKLDWKISKEEFEVLTQQDCFYCGLPPSNEAKSYYNAGGFTYNGIDRKDNLKGYVEGNTVSCCKICNMMKRELSVEEFLSHVNRIQVSMRRG